MAEKIHIFQSIRRHLMIIGAAPYSATEFSLLNAKILMVFLSLGIGIVCMLMYICNETKTFIKLTQSVYMLSVFTLLSVAYMILILNLNEWFNLISHCESLVNTRKHIQNAILLFEFQIKGDFLFYCSTEVLSIEIGVYRNASASGKDKRNFILWHR